MRKLIDYVHSCFCNHDWELVKHEEAERAEYPWEIRKHNWVYRCRKCGHMKTYKNY